MMNGSVILLSFLFIFLNFADLSLTQYALSTGQFVEMNPVLSNRINLLLIIKAIGITAIIGIAYYLTEKKMSFNPLVIVSAFYLFVIAWNIYQIFFKGVL